MRLAMWFMVAVVVLPLQREGRAQGWVFHYQLFPGSGRDLPVIPDGSGAGVDGLADSKLRMNSSVPTEGVPLDAGTRSLNGKGTAGVLSGGTQELSNSLIADAGGFTFETWFKWNGGGTVNSIIDYAGTEKLIIDATEGSGNEIRMRINDDSSIDSILGMAQSKNWHYVAAVFDTMDNSVDGGSITGQFDFYLDGSHIESTVDMTISDLGDSRNQGIGVSKNPAGIDFFDGLIFEPRVTLGALDQNQLLYVVPEPSGLLLWLVGCGALLLLRRR